MQIEYEVKDTAAGERGKGLFSTQYIKQGAYIWHYNANPYNIPNVIEYTEKQTIAHLSTMPTLAAAKRFLELTYGRGELLCLIVDSGRFINHAAPPHCNCRTEMKTGHVYALTDIAPGAELFEDYATFDHPPYLYGLLEKYECSPTYYAIPPAQQDV